MAWHGIAWRGVVWHGVVWHGVAWRGAVRWRLTWHGCSNTTMKPVIYFSHAKADAFLGTFGIGHGVLAAP